MSFFPPLAEALAMPEPANHALIVELARLPEQIRGFGHVKDANIALAKRREAEIISALRRGPVSAVAAE